MPLPLVEYSGLVLSSALGSYWSSSSSQEKKCTCICELPPAPEPDQRILDILARQLERCSPERLGQLDHGGRGAACPTCPPAQECPAAQEPWGLLGIALALVVGLVLGRLSALLRLPLRPRAAVEAGSRPRSAPATLGPPRPRAAETGSKEGAQAEPGPDPAASRPPPERGPGGASPTEALAEPGEAPPCGPGADEPGDWAYGAPARGAEDAERSDGSNGAVPCPEDDEEDLGIIDAGDEEWLEVFDVIREHSAVTIFKRPDSTWYVSANHPTFVRPLHGKSRHPLKENRRRSPSPTIAEAAPMPWPARVASRRAEAARSSPTLVSRLENPGSGHLLVDRSSPSMASLQACAGRRRPHSAPNRSNSLATAGDGRFGSTVGSQWAAAVREGSGGSMAGVSAGRADASNRSRRSAEPVPMEDRAASYLAMVGTPAMAPDRGSLPGLRWPRAENPHASGDIFVEEDRGSSSSSGTSDPRGAQEEEETQQPRRWGPGLVEGPGLGARAPTHGSGSGAGWGYGGLGQRLELQGLGGPVEVPEAVPEEARTPISQCSRTPGALSSRSPAGRDRSGSGCAAGAGDDTDDVAAAGGGARYYDDGDDVGEGGAARGAEDSGGWPDEVQES